MLEAECDYLEFTVPADRRWDLVGVLPGGVEVLSRGWRGYTHSGLLAGGKGRIGWSPERPEMGVHVSLGSQALDVLGVLEDAWAHRPDVVGLIQDGLGGRVTRFDVAFDDFEGALQLDTIEAALYAGHYTSRWKSGRVVRGFGRNQGGRTFYVGSPRSNAMLLVYDKAAERAAKGVAFEGEHWVRVELRLRRERANAAASLFKGIREDAGRVFRHLAGVLRGYIEFKQPNGGDSNKRRWRPAAWWLQFVGHVEKARLAVRERELRTVEDVKGWFSLQVAPSVALLEESMGKAEAWAWILGETEAGRLRWRAKHRAILAASTSAPAG